MKSYLTRLALVMAGSFVSSVLAYTIHLKIDLSIGARDTYALTDSQGSPLANGSLSPINSTLTFKNVPASAVLTVTKYNAREDMVDGRFVSSINNDRSFKLEAPGSRVTFDGKDMKLDMSTGANPRAKVAVDVIYSEQDRQRQEKLAQDVMRMNTNDWVQRHIHTFFTGADEEKESEYQAYQYQWPQKRDQYGW